MKKGSFWALLIGMWSMTQIRVIGFLGISEIFIYMFAPFVLIRYWRMFKQDGMGKLFGLLFLTMVSCLISGWYNNNDPVNIIKGFATIYGFFACITVIYPLLRKNPNNLQWMVLGFAISGVISIFIFQPGSSYTGSYFTRESLQESVMGYALFWTNQITTWSSLPIKIAYLKTPTVYSVLTPFATSLYALLSTSSGRSTFVIGMFGVLLLLLGGKSKSQLSKLRKYYFEILCVLLVGGIVFALIYKNLARSGALGEMSRAKYERQVQDSGRGEDLLGIIMGGRLEVFIGGYACIKNPILGLGPKAVDDENLIGYFFNKYGTHEDIESFYKSEQRRRLFGLEYRSLPAHSHIISFWLWFGIVGGLLWVYILIVMFKTLKNDMNAIPQWFGYFALLFPSTVLAIFISPFGGRVETALLVCACFIARNVNNGRIQLPYNMIKEIYKYDR